MRALQLLPIALIALAPIAASANLQNPAVVRDEYDLGSLPSCTLCHTQETGIKNSATKPFAQNLRRLGVSGVFEPQTLVDALSEIRSCEIDSDGDGATDFDEITGGANPNDGSGPSTSKCEFSQPNISLPAHGCAVSAPRAARQSPASSLVTGAFVTFVLRRRRTSRVPALQR